MKNVGELLAGGSYYPKALKDAATSLRRTAGLVRSALNLDAKLTPKEQETLLAAVALLGKMADMRLQAGLEAKIRQARQRELESTAYARIEQLLTHATTTLERLVFVAHVLPHTVQWIRTPAELDKEFQEAKGHLAWRVAGHAAGLEVAFETALRVFEGKRQALRNLNADLAREIEAGSLPPIDYRRTGR